MSGSSDSDGEASSTTSASGWGKRVRLWMHETGEHVGGQVKQHTKQAESDTIDEWDDHFCSWRCRAFWSVTFVLFCSLIYGFAVEQVYNGKAPRTWEVVLAICFLSGAVLGVSIAASSAGTSQWFPNSQRSLGSNLVVGWSAIIFGTSVLLQFEVYMMLIFQEYPFACEVYAVDSGIAQKMQGVKTGHLLFGWTGHLQDTGSVTISSKEDGDFDWDVECKDTVSVFGVKGGREVVCLMSHCVPFLILVLYANGLGSHLRGLFGGMFIDFIDLQDFGLLLLDDQLLLGYWNHADMYTSQGGRNIWWAIIIIFMIAGTYISFSPLLKLLSMPHGDKPGRCCGKPVSLERRFMCEAVGSLFLVELPFGIMRLWCSNSMHIFASSLLLKNILAGIYDILKIASCADPKGFLKRYPLLRPIFELTEFYTSEGLDDFIVSADEGPQPKGRRQRARGVNLQGGNEP